MTAATILAGCDGRPASADARATTASGTRPSVATAAVHDHVARGPAEVARLLNELHRKGDYDGIAAFITPDRRDGMMTLLRAIDGVFAADGRLRAAAIERYGGPHAVAWDLSVLRNNLGLFSAQTNVINQSFAGDRGMVTLQEGNHVPLVRAPFVCREGRWLYEPELPSGAVAKELVKLAGVIGDIRAAVEAGEDFGPYLESFHGKMVPQMRAVVMAKDEADVRVTAAQDEE
ncbi:MAG: hypothetical protein IPK83_06440 [Planctomycetes bacterium]|nr:hypothetical protein [Planctomycetota bacterium]